MRRANSTQQWLLKAMRERLGLTQDQLARVSGVSQPFISMYELGRRDVFDGDADRLAEALTMLSAVHEMRRHARKLVALSRRS